MSDFEWHTEDDWQDEPEQPERESVSRRWLLPVALVALLGLVSIVVYTQLRETVDEAAGQIEENVIASFGILQNSAETSDIELFSGMLSGRDRDWTTGYQILIGSGTFNDRDSFQLVPISERPEITNIELSADLRSAVVTATTAYAVPVGNGITQTVSLNQPYIFRQGETRWLFAPPEEDFWGERETNTAGIFVYNYLQRDKAIVTRLMQDFEAAYLQLCDREFELHCGERMWINFSNAPSALSDIANQPYRIPDQWNELPTPSIVGLPTNEDAYRALRSGYARLILGRRLAERTGYQCCARQAVFEALLDQLSAEMGLRANLDAPNIYRVAHENLNINTWPLGWWRTDSDDTTLTANHAFALYLRQQFPNVSTYKLIALLAQYDNPRTWMQQVVAQIDPVAGGASEQLIFEANFNEFRLFLAERLDRFASNVQPVSLPTGEPLFACGTMLLDASGDAVQQFQEPVVDAELLPDQQTLFVRHGLPDSNNDGILTATYLYRGDERTLINDTRIDYFGRTNPTGDQIYLSALYRSQPGSAEGLFGYFSMETAACANGNCPIERIAGTPEWSPDGQHVIYISLNNALFLHDAQDNKLAELPGIDAFWIDNERFVYNVPEIGVHFLGAVDGSAPVPYLTLEQIVEAIGDASLVSPVNYLTGKLDGTNWIELDGAGGRLLVAAAPSGETLQLSQSRLRAVSPQQTWITYETQADNQLIFANWTDGLPTKTFTIPFSQNSRVRWLDDEWALVWHDIGYAELVAPGLGLSEVIYSAENCTDVTWSLQSY